MRLSKHEHLFEILQEKHGVQHLLDEFINQSVIL